MSGEESFFIYTSNVLQYLQTPLKAAVHMNAILDFLSNRQHSAYHADQFAIFKIGILVVVTFISTSHVVLQAASDPHHLHMETPSHLREWVGMR